MTEEEKKTIVAIEGTEYVFEDMTPEQQAYINHVADLDSKIRTAKFSLDQLEFSRAAFMNQLKFVLSNPEESPTE